MGTTSIYAAPPKPGAPVVRQSGCASVMMITQHNDVLLTRDQNNRFTLPGGLQGKKETRNMTAARTLSRNTNGAFSMDGQALTFGLNFGLTPGQFKNHIETTNDNGVRSIMFIVRTALPTNLYSVFEKMYGKNTGMAFVKIEDLLAAARNKSNMVEVVECFRCDDKGTPSIVDQGKEKIAGYFAKALAQKPKEFLEKYNEACKSTLRVKCNPKIGFTYTQTFKKRHIV